MVRRLVGICSDNGTALASAPSRWRDRRVLRGIPRLTCGSAYGSYGAGDGVKFLANVLGAFYVVCRLLTQPAVFFLRQFVLLVSLPPFRFLV